MGNRAIVIFREESGDLSPATYLHWNGGPDSVYAFLAEMDRRKVRTGDNSYEAARFVHIVGDFFDQDGAGGLSLGVFDAPRSLEDLEPAYSHGDNGVYVVTRHNGAPPDVRRFTGYPLSEASSAEVEAERKEAETHAAGFAEAFAKLRPNVSAHG